MKESHKMQAANKLVKTYEEIMHDYKILRSSMVSLILWNILITGILLGLCLVTLK